jgi:hypothetical protein
MRPKPLLAVAFWLAMFGALAVHRHGQYLHRLAGYRPDGPTPERLSDSDLDRETPDHPRLTLRQALQLGWTTALPHRNSSSYVLHAPGKAPGRIRIGIFGDSHVEGAEVAKDFDFPTLLQQRLQSSGERRVEIVNFGVSGYGFSQSFLMWEFFAERYELDRAIFVIGSQYFERDDTFALNDEDFSSIHARYVLRGGKPELMTPLGRSYQQMLLFYHGLAPVWRYLRYDARMPVMWRMLLSFPTSSRFNPFYYYAPFGDVKREMMSIERLLLARAAVKMPVILIFDRNFGPYREGVIGSTDVDFMGYGVYPQRDIMLRAPMSHFSALGNRLRAEQVFAFLTGKKTVEFPFVDLVPLAAAAARTARPLHEFADGVLSLDGKPVGRLMVHKRDAPQPHFMEPLDLRERRVSALFNAGGNDPAFVALNELPGRSDAVVLSFTLDGEPQEAALGRASAPYGILASLEAGPREWRGASRTGVRWNMEMTTAGFIDGIAIHSSGKISDPSVRLAGREILRGAYDGDRPIIFKPLDGELIRIREEAGQDFDPFHVKKTGVLCVGKNVPFIGYRLVPAALPPFERPLRAPLRIQ